MPHSLSGKRQFAVSLLIALSVSLFLAGPASICFAQKPGGSEGGIVPQFGDLRYAITYASLDAKTLAFYDAAKINILHWHGPFHGSDGLPDRKKLPAIMQEAIEAVHKAHNLGMKILFYVSPVMSYGDDQQRTKLFNFYDRGWNDYQNVLGPKPDDPIRWVQKTDKGNPKIYKYARMKGYYLCPNNESQRQYVRGLLKLIVQTGADGAFFDGPDFPGGTCYCDACKRKFRESIEKKLAPSELKSLEAATGEILIPIQNTESLWLEWQQFFADSLYDFLMDMKTYARTLNPRFILTANYWTRDPYESLREHAQDAAKWSAVVDVFFSESNYGSGPYMETGIKYSNSYLYKYLVAASGSTPVALLKTAVKSNDPHGQFNLTKLCIAEAASNQATWQFHELNGSAQEAAVQYNRFLADHADLYKGWQTYADIAVVSSPRQVYYGHTSYDAALSRFLTDNHVMHSMIVKKNMNLEILSQYKTVIFPDVQVMSDALFRTVEAFMEQGGSAIFLGKTAEYNIDGKQRDMVNHFLHHAKVKAGARTEIITVGRGTLIISPITDLPMLVRAGLGSKENKALREALTVLEGAMKQERILFPETDSSVEFSVYQKNTDAGSKLAVHMVNYMVDKAGNLSEKKGFAISIRLPQGYTCKKAMLHSPDWPEKETPLEFDTIKNNGVDYVKTTITNLQVYDVLVLEIKNKNEGH